MCTREKKEFNEFTDYEFVKETDDIEKFNELIYLKVLGKDNEYLGSTWIAILKDFSKEEIKSFVEEILSVKYPLHRKHNIIHYKK